MKTNKSFKLILSLGLCFVFSAHNLYLKMDGYFLKTNQKATLSLYNGTFQKSENIITRDRILDASIVYKGNRYPIDSTQWTDRDSTVTQFNFTPIEEGTYVTGVSTKARAIKLSAADFNDYLKHDGVVDMLQERTDNNLLNVDALESYEKHVKAIYQVGDTKTQDWSTVLGYPIEFVPESNPYEKSTGEKLGVKLLLEGKPLANQLVYVDYVHATHDHDHDHDDHHHEHNDGDHHDHKHNTDGHENDDHNHDDKDHSHSAKQELRTDSNGSITIDLPEDGIYYLRTIHMTSVDDDSAITHRSKWATLTFQVTHSHDHHSHDQEDGIPTWIFVLGSALFIGILFIFFRKK